MNTVTSTVRPQRGPSRKKLRATIPCLCGSWLIILFLACQTPPAPEFSFDDSVVPLEPGAFVYLFADKNAGPILEKFIPDTVDNKHLRQMIDLTQFAAAAAYAQIGGGVSINRGYRLTAWGNYPVSRARMALGAGRGWKKQRSAVSGTEYWSAQGISVAIIPGRALVSVDTGNQQKAADPFTAGLGTLLPDGFGEFRKGSVLSCWFDNPGIIINRRLEEMGIPIELPAERLFISFTPINGQRYEARLRILLPGETQARALAVVFTIAGGFLSPATASGNTAVLASILFANPPVQDRNSLNLTSAPLSVEDISLLFKMFSL